ncbi:MAG: hypothetical protein MZV64_36375, partial [Ignavibacteriales bacterium]|nr:hypothetical protein [Ignavibacteriales bacterium]
TSFSYCVLLRLTQRHRQLSSAPTRRRPLRRLTGRTRRRRAAAAAELRTVQPPARAGRDGRRGAGSRVQVDLGDLRHGLHRHAARRAGRRRRRTSSSLPASLPCWRRAIDAAAVRVDAPADLGVARADRLTGGELRVKEG